MSARKPWVRPAITEIKTGGLNKFGATRHTRTRSSIDGALVPDLIRQYGSPLFIFSESTLRNNYRQAQAAFSSRYPETAFAWSYKTNYLGAICNAFHQEGALAEVVSAFEYEKARALGVPGDCIIFNGPKKDPDILAIAAREKAYIHIDHLEELHILEQICRQHSLKAKVGIRLNFSNPHCENWSRFGFNIDNGQAIDAARRIHKSKHLQLLGLHSHIGTFVLEPRAYQVQATRMCEFLHELEAQTESVIEYLDFGGGFASENSLQGTYLPPDQVVPGIDQYADAICETVLEMTDDRESMGRHRPRLILETGRALVDNSAFLASTVIAAKDLPDGRRALVMDAGVNVLFTAFWYNHDVTPIDAIDGDPIETSVFGPMCMNIDVLRNSVMLPPLEAGHIVLFSPAGAYNNTQWMQFIEYRPAVVLIDPRGQAHCIRRREDLQIVTSPEQIPDHLARPYRAGKPGV